MIPTITDELALMRIAELRAEAQEARLRLASRRPRRRSAGPQRGVRIGAGRIMVRYGLRLITGPPAPTPGGCRPAA